MTELKTLKDFLTTFHSVNVIGGKHRYKKCPFYGKICNYDTQGRDGCICHKELHINYDVDTRKLKKEAIKWIKQLLFEQDPAPFTAIMPAPNYEPVIHFIKHFFNITEENLK